MTETDLMNVVAVEIEVTTALHILNPRPAAGFESGQAGRREGLMEKIFRVFVEQSLCFRRKVLRGPGAAPGREIHIAFGTVLVERWFWLLEGTHLSGFSANHFDWLGLSFNHPTTAGFK